MTGPLLILKALMTLGTPDVVGGLHTLEGAGEKERGRGGSLERKSSHQSATAASKEPSPPKVL